MAALNILSAVLTSVFLAYILSYYVLLFIRRPQPPHERNFTSLTVLIPARNESRRIEECIRSVIAASFEGKKQIIVIDDASLDDTAQKARQKGILFLQNKTHKGKSFSLNKGLGRATGELIAVVDGDSIIQKDALAELATELSKKDVVAAAAVVKVKNTRAFINPWVHVELIYNSLIRSLFAKIGANVVTPGALSMYRKDALKEVGNFSTSGFSEDLDIAVRLARKGYRVSFCDTAISETDMPADLKGFARQRSRIARGLVYALRKHMQINNTVIDLYTFPLFLFIYVQAMIMGALTIYQLISGYLEYFVAYGDYFSFAVIKFFFMWFSFFGFVDWSWSLLSGQIPIDFLSVVAVSSTLLTYPLFLYAIVKYDKRPRLSHIAALFMLPYWLILMLFNVAGIAELFRKEQYNRWKKNEP